MGLDSGSQTWLHIRSKIKRESFKKTNISQTPLTMKSESSGIFLKVIELITIHPLSFVKH